MKIFGWKITEHSFHIQKIHVLHCKVEINSKIRKIKKKIKITCKLARLKMEISGSKWNQFITEESIEHWTENWSDES